jgi:O-antigen/teichoic acid export membrane protein
MESALRVVRNSVFLIAGQLFGVGVNLGTIALISRYLPLEQFGDYGFILAISMTFMVLTDMGGNRIAIREMARNLDRAREIFSIALILRCGLSVVSFFAIVATVHLTSASPAVIHSTYLAGLASVVFILGDVYLGVFMAYERMEYNALLQLVTETVYLLAVLAVVEFDLGLDGIFSALLVSYVVRFLAGHVMLRTAFFRPRLYWDLPMLVWILREGVPIGINRLLRKASFRVDTFVLQLMRTRQEVGIFHGVYRVILVILFVPRMITDALFPSFARYAEESSEQMAFAFEKSFKFLLILVLPLILVVFLAADPIVRLLLGKKFAEGGPLLQLFSLVWGLTFFSVLCNKVLNAAGRQGLATLASAACLGVNVVLDIALIPYFGYMGAAAATAAAEFALLVVSLRMVSRHVCRTVPASVLAKPLFAFVLALATAWVFSGGREALLVAVALPVYAATLLLTTPFDDDELAVLRAIGRKVRRRVLRPVPSAR